MKNFLETLEKVNKILITSHVNCDQDGITSALSTKLLIQKNLSNKKVCVNIESQLQQNISFLKDFDSIKTENLVEKIKTFKPELIIFTDGQTPERFSKDHIELEKLINGNNIFTTIIDHHAGQTTFKPNFHYNNLRSSCAQEVYHLFVQELGFKINKDIAKIIMAGMIFDTGVFVYKNNNFRETANVISDLVEIGAVIEEILFYKNECTKTDLTIISELSKNLNIKDKFCYSYISDEFYQDTILGENITEDEFIKGRHIWTNTFLKNIQGCSWGFLIYQTNYPGKYRVTLRSRQEGKVVRRFAEKFKGGGHDHAAGFSIEAKNVKVAIEEILQKI